MVSLMHHKHTHMTTSKLAQDSAQLLMSKQSSSLKAFQRQYPAITSADMQSWLLGYQAAIDLFVEISSLHAEEEMQMAKLG